MLAMLLPQKRGLVHVEGLRQLADRAEVRKCGSALSRSMLATVLGLTPAFSASSSYVSSLRVRAYLSFSPM